MLKLASNRGNVSAVEPFVEKYVTRYNLSPDKQCNILISLTEAVTNAIVHGNCNEEEKTVEVSMKRQKNCLAVRVSDQGHGFDFDSLPDPTSPARIEECGGRGVFLMRELSDQLHFCRNGSTVEMRFKI